MTEHGPDIEAIRQRASAATVGPWAWEDNPGAASGFGDIGPDLIGPVESDGLPVCILVAWGYDASGVDITEQDKEFIAHAREDVPALLDYIATLEAALERLVLACESMEDCIDSLTASPDIRKGLWWATIADWEKRTAEAKALRATRAGVVGGGTECAPFTRLRLNS